jgi:hypothetical protein
VVWSLRSYAINRKDASMTKQATGAKSATQRCVSPGGMAAPVDQRASANVDYILDLAQAIARAVLKPDEFAVARAVALAQASKGRVTMPQLTGAWGEAAALREFAERLREAVCNRRGQ